MHNILTDRLIRYKTDDNSMVTASLPEVYAALMQDEIASFPALRPHQRHAWHAFLVQLGAMAMHRAGVSETPYDAETWRNLIRFMTPTFPDDEPWRLVVDDIAKPAFMQPPFGHSASDPKYTDEPSLTPDNLDPLDTAKNHALKRFVMPAKELDSWVFALITEQTTDAHLSNNPAISRISGKGSRLAFSLTPSTRLGIHIRRDITALLENFPLLGEGYSTNTNGHALLWTIPWDGAASEELTLDKLHPLYIEICRRRRMCLDSNGNLHTRRVSGTKTRIKKSNLKGRTGDPWIPENIVREKVLTLPKTTGFTYKQISNCLNATEWKLPLLCKPTQDEETSVKPMYLVARGIAPGDGQNKTGGYYERIIPINLKLQLAMMRPESTQAEDLGRMAKRRVDDVGKVQRILKDAIATFIAKGENIYDKDKFSRRELTNLRRRKEIEPWTKRLDEIVDTDFFEKLQIEFEADKSERDDIRSEWLWNRKDGVIDHARRILSEAEDTLPCISVVRYRASVNADDLFRRNIRSSSLGFPKLGYKDNER